MGLFSCRNKSSKFWTKACLVLVWIWQQMQVATCYAPITKISIRLYSSIANRERACIHHELHVTWASEASQLNPRTWKKNWFIKGNEIYQGVDAYEIRPIIMHRIHHFTGSFVVCANLLRNSTITNCTNHSRQQTPELSVLKIRCQSVLGKQHSSNGIKTFSPLTEGENEGFS